jgi:hypothetical protein
MQLSGSIPSTNAGWSEDRAQKLINAEVHFDVYFYGNGFSL